MRISRDQMLMDITKIVALRSSCQRGHVGCVISHLGRIISIGYNGAPSGLPHCTPETCNENNPCTHTVHAEANAIAFAAKQGLKTEGSILFCNYSPCVECAKLIINAGIVAVIFENPYRLKAGLNLLKKAGVTIRRYNENI